MKVCNLALKTVCRTPYIDRPFPERIGSCTVGKLQRILANRRFSQHAKLNMAGFVLYLLGSFALRCRMVSVCPKIKSVLPQRTQRPRSSVIALKPTPIWDGLGCSGIPREGGRGAAKNAAIAGDEPQNPPAGVPVPHRPSGYRRDRRERKGKTYRILTTDQHR
jgi:hypothetical protein